MWFIQDTLVPSVVVNWCIHCGGASSLRFRTTDIPISLWSEGNIATCPFPIIMDQVSRLPLPCSCTPYNEDLPVKKEESLAL